MKGSPGISLALVVAVVAIVAVTAWIRSDGEDAPSGPPSTERSQHGQPPAGGHEVLSAERDKPRSPPVTARGAAPQSLPRMIDLGADKCIPCKKMAPILEEVRAAWKGRAIVQFIDVWKNPAASKQYGVRLIPTQIFFDRNGREVWRHEGFLAKDAIVKQLKDLTAEE